MTTEAALTKLSYLLALPDGTPTSVARDMSISLRGELTEQSQTIFRHPDGVLPERIKNLTALGYAIAHGDLEKVREVMHGEPNWLLNDADYSGNTPMVRLTCCPPSIFYLTPVSLGANTAKLFNYCTQHLAATSPNLSILHHLLSQGGSVHLRSRAGRTPLFLAANAGLVDHVSLLRRSGAHLHADERGAAEQHARQNENANAWRAAGVDDSVGDE